MPDAHGRGNPQDPHAGQAPAAAGVPLQGAPFALILVHGRGGTPEGMLPVARAARATDGAVLAPRARGGSWYPNRFLAPIAENEPWLGSALHAIDRAVQQAREAGIPDDRILLVGFSQGACLSLEYAARRASSTSGDVRFGGIASLAGALPGGDHESDVHHGSLGGTPVFLSVGDADSHIPVSRVHAAAALFERLRATVDVRVYPGVEHSIVGDQLDALRAMLDVVRMRAAKS